MDFQGALPQVDLTYSDVFLIPRRSAITSRLDVDLAPADGTPATIPLVASNMNSVTGARLAATLARRGGLGVLPQDLSPEATLREVARVKQASPLWDSPFVLAASATVADAVRFVPPVAERGVVVVEDEVFSGDEVDASGVRASAIVGVVPASRLATALADATLGDLARGGATIVDAAELAGGPRAVFDALADREPEVFAVVADGLLVGTTSRRSALRGTLYRPALDAQGRLALAAAVGINGDVAGRARALAEAGVDVLVLDTAHGHQEGMLRALDVVTGLGLGLPIVAGNIVSADGVTDLVGAGATILKVGVGPGAMCTTRMMTAVGRPQFSAVLETAEAARALGAHVWADGGVRYPRDVALGLAAGAASVMIGSWFAGTIEAPGQLRADADGRVYKESWGMASTKAVHERFGGLSAYDLARKELFAEGISSSRIYLDQLRPGVEDLVDMITSGVRSSFTYAGASSVSEFHERALVGLQSAAGYEEGKALPVSW